MKVKIFADFNTLEEMKNFLEGISKAIDNFPEDFTCWEYRTATKVAIIDDSPMPKYAGSSYRESEKYRQKK